MVFLTAILGGHAETLVAICLPNAVLTVVSWLGYRKEKDKEKKDCYFGCIWTCAALFMFGFIVAVALQFGGESVRRFFMLMQI